MVKIVVVGMPGSGKNIFVQSALNMGFSHIRMGDVVREFARARGLGSDDENIGGFATEQREKHGAEIWARRTLERMPEDDVIIDGSRSLAEIEHFKTEIGMELIIIGIRASVENRFQRLIQRGRDDDPETMEEFEIRDRREMSWGISKALESADVVIDNDGGLKEFEQKCNDTLSDILKPHRKVFNKANDST